MLVRVLERAALSGAERVVAATDSEKVAEVTKAAGFETVITGACRSGSERAAAAAGELGLGGVVVNLQGDEPEADPNLIAELGERAGKGDCDCATAAAPISADEAESPDIVKVVSDEPGFAMYFSRAAIPARRNPDDDPPAYMGHIGIYAFAPGKVAEIAGMEPTGPERSEGLEQLCWLGNGWRIAVVRAKEFTCGIDTPEELAAASARLAGER